MKNWEELKQSVRKQSQMKAEKNRDSIFAQFGFQFTLIVVVAIAFIYVWNTVSGGNGELEAIYLKISALQTQPVENQSQISTLYDEATKIAIANERYNLLQVILIALGAMSLVPTITMLQMKAFTDIPFTKMWLLGQKKEITENQQGKMMDIVRTIYGTNGLIAALAVLGVVITSVFT